MTWPWGVCAALALLWPDRISGPFDGVPLDRTAEAIVVGLVFPALWWFHPRFLKTAAARAAIVLLVAWKAAASSLFVQDGWCVRFAPPRPYTWGAFVAPHAWDLRADWRTANPTCSAIMTRGYGDLADFPAWFLNLPPAGDGLPRSDDRPPDAAIGMTIQGFMSVPRDGTLRIETDAGVVTTIRVDGGAERNEAPLARGVHTVNIAATLTGDRWRLAPTFDARDLFAAATPTVKRPSRLDLAARPFIRWIPASLVVFLIVTWTLSALTFAADPWLLAWTSIASATIGAVAAGGRVDAARWMVAGLACAAALPLRARVRNMSGAFLAIGVPWLSLVVGASLPTIGRFTLYSPGNDWWTFQRFAYRIVMQGYWLEGGSATFWFQPLYRWIAGVLHMIFGDSSVGEWYWDGACLLAGSLFCFRVVRLQAGFRWGVVAGVLPLAVFTLSPEWGFLGRGLSEISSAGLIYVAALLAMRSRHGAMRFAIAAGIVATLGFYTRLNNLTMAGGAAVFAASMAVGAHEAVRLRLDRSAVAWSSAIVVLATIAAGIVFFAWRTWYYTGVFSVFYGTARDHLSIWRPDLPIAALLERAAGSVMMVLTLNDPARFDPYALPVLAGAAAAVLSLAGVPRLRALPLPLVLFFFLTIAGALIARGSAYSGRFSLHAIPIASALAVAGVAVFVQRRETKQKPEEERSIMYA